MLPFRQRRASALSAVPLRLVFAGLIVALLLAAVALVLLTGSRDEEGLDRVQRSGVLRVGMDASFPPFEALDDDGQIVGYDVDLAAAIAREMGVGTQFVAIGFDGLCDALQAERVDVIISGLPYDERRTRDVRYSAPYFNAGQVLVVRHGEAEVMDDLSAVKAWMDGRRVAVEWGSMGDMEMRRWQGEGVSMDIVAEADARGALGAVADGRAEAAVADLVSAYAHGVGDTSLEVAFGVTDEPYVIATALKSPRLAERVDEILAGLEAEGELAVLESRWLR